MHPIAKIWIEQPGKWFCLSTKDNFKKWEDHFFRKSEFKEIIEFIEEHKDRDIYWCPHGFNKPRRLKEHAVIPKLLWADLDEANPRDMGDLMPTVAWESSPGRYAALWKIDAFMNEDLNRRLSYYVEADKGGWDLTQVLRVPGTINYKYASTPKVKMLWSDGPEYEFDKIDKKVPQEKVKRADSTGAMAIYKKYESKFNTFIRKELLRGKPVKGKRSAVFWKLANELMEAGCKTTEIFELLRVSPWNKFKDRRDGDAQLKREIEKALSQHLSVSINGSDTFELDEEEEGEGQEEHQFLKVSMADVDEENIDWLWYPFLARKEMTILEGDPGLGKSYLAQMIAKAVCDGETLSSPKPRRIPKGRVAYFDVENSMGSVTKKRLMLNGCQNLQNFFQDAQPFSIDDEETLERVHKAIAELKPTLVVFDTINIYVGGADTHKASETQQMLSKFVEIGRRHNCAVMVLRHLTKSTKEKAIYRGQGSISFAGLARVVMTVGKVPEDLSDDPDIRAMAITKINIGKPPKALTFAIRELPDTLNSTDRSKFEWGDFVDLTADDIVSVVITKSDGNSKEKKKEEIIKFIEEMLEGGPMPAEKLYRAAEARSISRRLLIEVSDEMGIVKGSAKRGHKQRKSGWSLPKSYKNDDED